jgi:cobalt-zinc-cadmium resistance protein CzcA
MQALITFVVSRRWLVMAMTLVVAAIGLFNLARLAIDAVPDITNVQVQINSEAEGYSPLETEQRITYMIENTMAGLPKLDYTRSLSRYGLSQVTVIFKEGTDIYWARQQISERLQNIRSALPIGITPTLGPITTGLGEVLSYTVSAKMGALNENGQPYSLEELRTIQDWIIRPQLVKVTGITEINSLGGYVREYQVAPDPGRLLAYKVTMEDLIKALQNNNENIGAGYVERNGEQWLIRSPGQLKDITDIGNVVIGKRDDAPVRIKDVADVIYGKELRTGAATIDGQEVVLGTAFMLLGENSRSVAKAVAKKLQAINQTLPKGVLAEAVYDRTSLVDQTIKTVQKNLFEGAVLVILVLFILLGNFRAALITALVIPLSMLFAVTGMVSNKVSGNLMSLGAIDFGLIVDGAVIVVENTLRRLGLEQKRVGRLLETKERLLVVIESTKEVFSPAVFGVFIIMLVYLPIFTLSGVEGKMFHPMAFTVVAALLGALILAVTFVPAAIAIFVKGNINDKPNWLMGAIQNGYQSLLNIALKIPFIIIILATGLVAFSGIKVTQLGTEFLPQLDEHDMALHALRIPGTGLEQAIMMQKQLESVLIEIDEVSHVFSKIGTADIATDPMPPNVADIYLMLKPRSEWQNPDKPKAQFVNEMRLQLQSVPGNNYEITQPIEMRFNELIAGVRSDVAIRIYGDDLTTLAEVGQRAEALLSSVEGSQDVRLEQTEGLPMLSIEPERDHLALLGLSVSDVQKAIQIASNGIQAGMIYEGDRRFKLIVRMNETTRNSPEQLAKLPILLPAQANPDLSYVPLGEVATIKVIEGPNKINRESGKRNVVVSANVENKDLGSFIAETQTLMSSELNLPAGYWLEYAGTFEQLASATARLKLIVPLTLLLILVLLYTTFNSVRDSLLVFSGIPLALTGGVLALVIRDMPLSISASIGFIALSGIAVLNGVVMLSFIRTLREEGTALVVAIKHGAIQRLRPVLMTALVASLGFIPMALNTGMGSEVQRPLATVVIGGVISSTLLTLLVLPVLYKLVYQWSKQK